MKGYAIKFVTLFLLGFFCLNVTQKLNAQTTSVPDDNFENYLETHDSNGNVVPIGDLASMGDGIDGNDEVLTSRITNVLDLNIQNINISSFIGLEDFTSLTSFNHINNQAPTIDPINFDGNLSLTNLTIINCPFLSEVNIDQNILLDDLTLVTRGELFTSINLSNNTNLTSLSVADNALTSVDIQNNPLLTYLNIALNPITELDLSNSFQLVNLHTYESQLELLDVSNNPEIALVNADNGALKAVNLRNFANTFLSTVDLSGNPNLDCILVDDVTFALNASGWNPGTGNYIESTSFSLGSVANDETVSYEFGSSSNQIALDAWIANNGGANASSDCGEIIWSKNINIISSQIETNNIIIYEVDFVAKDVFGNFISTQGIFTIENVNPNHFNDEIYGTGDAICKDIYDLNKAITDIEPTADLYSPEIESFSFTRISNFQSNEGPSGESISGTDVDFPDSGAGSYSYLFKVTVQKEVEIYNPELGGYTIETFEDEGEITINNKTVPFNAGEDITTYINPLDEVTTDDLTNNLNITPDPTQLPPQFIEDEETGDLVQVDPAEYWYSEDEYLNPPEGGPTPLLINTNVGPGTYIFDASVPFAACFPTPEEAEAAIAKVTVVGGYEFGLVHIDSNNFKIVVIPSFDTTVNTEVTTMEFTLMLPTGSSNIQNISGNIGGGNWSVDKISASTLSTQGLGDGTRDAFVFYGDVNEPFLSHTEGQQINFLSFSVGSPPGSGKISFLANSDPIAIGANGAYNSVFESNVGNTFLSDNYFRIEPSLESFEFATLSLSDIEFSDGISVYPNPTKDNLILNGDISELRTVEIYSISGRQIIELNNNFEKINISQLESSIYFVKLSSENSTKTFKIIKE